MALCNNFRLSGRIVAMSTASEGAKPVHRATVAVPIQRKRIKELEGRGQEVQYGDCDYVTVVDYGDAGIDWGEVEEGMHATFEGSVANRDPQSKNVEFVIDDAIFPQLLE